MIQVHWLLARGAVQEVEYDSGRGPLVLNNLLDAIDMKNVAAT